MKEKELNNLIRKNFTSIGWAYKIPDPSKENIVGYKDKKYIFNVNPRPFDGIAVMPEFVLFWEAKLINEYKAFSFSRISDHQMSNLLKIKLINVAVYACIVLGVYLFRKGVDLFFFDINNIANSILGGAKSIKKKELLEFKERNLYLPIRKQEFKVREFPQKVIRVMHG